LVNKTNDTVGSSMSTWIDSTLLIFVL